MDAPSFFMIKHPQKNVVSENMTQRLSFIAILQILFRNLLNSHSLSYAYLLRHDARTAPLTNIIYLVRFIFKAIPKSFVTVG